MPIPPEGNGRRHAPDENRPSWRAHDESYRRRASEDDRFDDDRHRYWEDRPVRDWPPRHEDERTMSRNVGYPGTFEDRYRERSSGPDERFAERSDTYRMPRGYGYADGDRPNYGTGGLHGTGYGHPGYYSRPYASGHRGKGPASYQHSDERIRELVCEALTEDDRIDATNVEVTVKNGEVLLAGSVEDRMMKRLAEDVAENVGGVKDVQNQIRVSDKGRQTFVDHDAERRHRA